MARSAQHARQSCAPARPHAQGRAGRSRWHAPSSRASYGMAPECITVPHRHGRAGLCDPYQQPPGEATNSHPVRIIRRHDRIDCPVAMAAVEVGCVVDRVAGGLDEFAAPDDRPLAGPARASTGRGRRVLAHADARLCRGRGPGPPGSAAARRIRRPAHDPAAMAAHHAPCWPRRRLLPTQAAADDPDRRRPSRQHAFSRRHPRSGHQGC